MQKKRPLFMEKEEWYYKTKLFEKDTYKLTKLGMSIPKVLKSYMDYYNIKNDYIFKHVSNYDINAENEAILVDGIKKRMKDKKVSDYEINKFVNLVLNIDEIIEKENSEDY